MEKLIKAVVVAATPIIVDLIINKLKVKKA